MVNGTHILAVLAGILVGWFMTRIADARYTVHGDLKVIADRLCDDSMPREERIRHVIEDLLTSLGSLDYPLLSVVRLLINTDSDRLARIAYARKILTNEADRERFKEVQANG